MCIAILFGCCRCWLCLFVLLVTNLGLLFRNNHVDFGMATFDTRMDLELKGHSSDLVDDFDFVE